MKYKTFTLEELTEKIFSGGTPSTKIKEYWDGNLKWLSSGETSNDFIYDTDAKITELGVEKSSTKLASKNDLVMASAGQGKTRGQISYLMTDTYINQSVIAIRTNRHLLDEKYLYYNLKSRYRELRSVSDSASTRGSISTKMLKEFKISIPKIEEQKKVSNLLFNLDKKIEINNKIIDNLESQAQDIFKSWFVDFEPFQDAEFVESELGQIPKGWEVKELKDIAKTIVTGKTPSTKVKEYYGDKIPFITIPDMHGKIFIIESERYLSECGENSQKNKTLPANSICVSCIATVGLVSLTACLSQTNQQINSIIAINEEYIYYLYLYLKNMAEYLKAIGSGGSTTKNVNKKTFESIKIIFPRDNVLKRFDSHVKNNFELIKNLQLQNKKIAELRDTLLPKLMSGEIDVSNIDI